MKNEKVPTVEVKLGPNGFTRRYSYASIAEAAKGINEELESKRRQMARELLQTNPWVAEHQRRNPHHHTISQSDLPKNLHSHSLIGANSLSDLIDDEDKAKQTETKTIHCVRCQRCRATTTYRNFLYHGTRIKECKCKPGREIWVSVDVEVEVTDGKMVKAP